MTLKYVEKKEFSGEYNTTTMLIYSDNEIEEENIGLVYKFLNLYQGNSGELIEYKIIFDKSELIYKINVIIICFNTLLADVRKKNYLKFVKMHKKQFNEYYTKVFRKLIN